ncbi:MAG: LPS-assembly protein LptD [Bacteroidales bacterium]|nr:LPS-assembly protein LptD [Bacteroidales bacterium]
MISASASTLAQNDRRARRASARAREAAEASAAKDAAAAILQDPTDSISLARMDSLAHARDSVHVADSIARADSLELLGKSSINVPAYTTARDSVIEVFTDGQRLIYYYGDVNVKYDDIELTADYMEFDMNTGILYARGTLDTLTGEWKGRPVMKQGKSNYEMEELRYNFNTRRARIKNMVTNDADAILHGRDIKMLEDKSINIANGIYTVCDAPDPHYCVHMSLAKVVTEPTRKTVFGPAWMEVEGVQLPIGIPFGFLPPNPKRATGMLMPTFGEETARGFYMRDAGMYFVIGDYFDLSLTGSIYTLGSWAVDVNSRYKVNYKFNGNFSLTYSNDQTGERGSTDFFQTRNFGLRWSHSQDSKAHPGTSFSASVNFSSPSNSRYNSRSVTEALQNQISSSISYSHNWGGKVNLSVNALHSQNSRDSSYTFTLPNVTLSVSTFYPFKQKNRVGKEKVYEKISFGYNTSLQNKISFKAKEFGQEGFTDKFKNGMSHNFSIGLPSFTLLKYLNFNPSVSYGQNWFFRSSEYVYNPDTNKVEQKEGKQFGTFGITQTYSGGISMSTRLYGMFNFGQFSKVQAIRHVISPSMSFSYRPELGTYANGWRELNYTDKDGNDKTYAYNIYAGQLNSAPGKGHAATMSLSIANNLEAKVRDFADTTGKGTKKVKLIDQLSINTGYNFLADSLNMNNIGVTMSTSLFGKISLSANANFDPYAINERGQRIGTFNIVKEGLAHPLRLTNASASTSYSISGKGTINGDDGSKAAAGDAGSGSSGGGSPASYYNRVYYHPITGEYIPGGWVYYTNPEVPWSVNASYSFSYSKSYSYANNQLTPNNRFTSTINLSGNIRLSPKMSINASSGFDLMAMKMTTSQLSATYDLHCFNISVSWVPTGTWQSYSFRIAANAAALSDLLRFKRSSSYWDH